MARWFLLKVLKVLPLMTLLYSFWLIYVTLRILHNTDQNYTNFVFLAFQVYINWAAIVCVSSNCVSAGIRGLKPWELKEKQDMVNVDIFGYEHKSYGDFSQRYSDDYQYFVKTPETFPQGKVEPNISNSVNDDFVTYRNYVANADIQKVWYCRKCCLNCPPNCRHCPLCSKCIFEHDHHCLFLGACIGRQNMKHFIVILLYIALVCLYLFNLGCVEMNLYEDVSNDSSLILKHFFPVAFINWLVGHERTYNFLQILFLNSTALIALFSFIFEVYYLCLVLSGKLLNRLQKNRRNPSGMKNSMKNFSAIFGEYGILHFIVPIGFGKTILKKYF